MKRISLSCIVFLLLVFSACQQKQLSLQERLNRLSADTIIRLNKHDTLFSEVYEIHLRQPLDHDNPQGESFTQRIYLSHIDPSKPVVLVTEGYAAPRNYTTELSRYLQANQIIVEHRYFGESVPDSMDWTYLTTWQAASDHHRVIELFKRVYPGKWLSTGISKGGQTVLFHSYYFPEDVDVRVPYVAPLNFSREDPRIYEHLRSVSSDTCRKRVHAFQKRMLEEKETFFPLFLLNAGLKNMRFSRVGGPEKAYELSALEYSFAFWQWGGMNCMDIPLESDQENEVFLHFDRIGSFDYFSDASVREFEPFFYQAMTEIGYYGYDYTEFEGQLEYVSDSSVPDFAFAAPQNTAITWNKDLMYQVNEYIQNRADHFLFIYGEEDTWTATGVELTGATGSLKVVKPGGDHLTRISNLDPENQKKALEALEQWMQVKVVR